VVFCFAQANVLDEHTGTPVARVVNGNVQSGSRCGVFATPQGGHTVAGSCSGVKDTGGSSSHIPGLQVSEGHAVFGPVLNATPLRSVPARCTGTDLFDRVSNQLGKASAIHGGVSPMSGKFICIMPFFRLSRLCKVN
jgi:hypothetical protein